MRKISHSDHISAVQFSMSDSLNPQQSETRCKICFQQKVPLVTLCDCTGSIAYVHQDCILDWIALRMQKSEVIEIPNCEICKAKFSAAIKIGSKRIDNKLLIEKIKTTSKKDWLIFSASILAFTVAFITIFMSIFFLILGDLLSFDTIGAFTISVTKVLFLHLLFPTMFIMQRMDYFKGKWRIIDACKVQLVQVTLLPKKILKA